MRGLTWPGHAPVILATSATTVMSGAAIAPALADIHESLAGPGSAPALARLALVLPALVVMLFAPLIARRSAALLPRQLIVGALCLIALFGSLAALSTGYVGFLLSRAALGVAAAAALSAAMAAIARRYEGAMRTRMLSVQTAANTFAAVAFILLGGLLAGVDWRLACLLYLLALPVAAAAWRLDWGEPDALGSGGASLSRMVPTRATVPLAMIFVAMGAFYLLPTQVPFLPGIAGSPLVAGLVIGLGTLASAPAALFSGKLAVRIGTRGAILSGFALIALGCLEMALASGALAGIVAATLIGAGFGLTVPAATLEAFGSCGPAERSAVSGRVASALCGGQVLAMLYATAGDMLGGPTAPFWSVAALIVAAFVSRGAAAIRAERRSA